MYMYIDIWQTSDGGGVRHGRHEGHAVLRLRVSGGGRDCYSRRGMIAGGRERCSRRVIIARRSVKRPEGVPDFRRAASCCCVL